MMLLDSDPTPAHGIERPAVVTFTVYGHPQPQGSKRAFVVNGHAVMKEAAAGHAEWRDAVAVAARREAERLDAPLDGALQLVVTFRHAMPSSRPKWKQRLGMIPKTSAPDLDKLIRVVGDALTAAKLITDDARIVTLYATKDETTGWTGAGIEIRQLPEPVKP